MDFNSLLKENILFDFHSHISDKAFDEDRVEVVERTLGSETKIIIDMSTDITTLVKSVDLAKSFPGIIYSAAGFHPELLTPGSEMFQEKFSIPENIQKLESAINLNKENIIMIGEIGMDFYWLEKNESLTQDQKEVVKNNQRELFHELIKLSDKLNLPVSIHSRGCVDACIEIVSKENSPTKVRGVFHSLTNDDDDQSNFENQVRKILDLNFKIGINGIITYKSASLIRDVIIKIIKENLSGRELDPFNLYESGFVLETDSPYLPPVNYSPRISKRNEPGSIHKIFDFLVNNIN